MVIGLSTGSTDIGGTKAIAMQSLQLHLTGAARSWLNTLPNESIGSWGELEN
jgi:hypothetical protein